MDAELSLVTGLTRRLPAVRGSLRLAYALGDLYNRKPRPLVIATVHGAQMELVPSEYVDVSLLLCPHLYDRWEFEIVTRYVQPGHIAFDVGSHIGTYAIRLSQLVGATGHVFAFEAWTPTFERLRRNLERNAVTNVTAKNVALSDQPGKATMYLNAPGNAGGNTLLNPSDWTGGEVECMTLIEASKGIDHIDFMKIDIENMEYRVLQHFLSATSPLLHPKVILTEHHANEVHLAGGDLLVMLQQFGYRLLAKSPPRTEPNFLFFRD
jgi:FkbM family methyltransferase